MQLVCYIQAIFGVLLVFLDVGFAKVTELKNLEIFALHNMLGKNKGDSWSLRPKYFACSNVVLKKFLKTKNRYQYSVEITLTLLHEWFLTLLLLGKFTIH